MSPRYEDPAQDNVNFTTSETKDPSQDDVNFTLQADDLSADANQKTVGAGITSASGNTLTASTSNTRNVGASITTASGNNLQAGLSVDLGGTITTASGNNLQAGLIDLIGSFRATAITSSGNPLTANTTLQTVSGASITTATGTGPSADYKLQQTIGAFIRKASGNALEASTSDYKKTQTASITQATGNTLQASLVDSSVNIGASITTASGNPSSTNTSNLSGTFDASVTTGSGNPLTAGFIDLKGSFEASITTASGSAPSGGFTDLVGSFSASTTTGVGAAISNSFGEQFTDLKQTIFASITGISGVTNGIKRVRQEGDNGIRAFTEGETVAAPATTRIGGSLANAGATLSDTISTGSSGSKQQVLDTSQEPNLGFELSDFTSWSVGQKTEVLSEGDISFNPKQGVYIARSTGDTITHNFASVAPGEYVEVWVRGGAGEADNQFGFSESKGGDRDYHVLATDNGGGSDKNEPFGFNWYVNQSQDASLSQSGNPGGGVWHKWRIERPSQNTFNIKIGDENDITKYVNTSVTESGVDEFLYPALSNSGRETYFDDITIEEI